MAIWTGNWRDGEGVAFDVNAKSTKTSATGGQAAVRRHRIRHHPSHAPFVAAIRRQRDRWWNVLDHLDRAEWDTPPKNQVSRRGGDSLQTASRFLVFNCKGFADQWADGSTAVKYPGGAALSPTGAGNFSIDLVNQTVTFDLDYPQYWTYTEDPAIVTFQADPRFVRGNGPRYHTRIIGLDHTFPAGPDTYTPTLSLAWPLLSSSTAAFLIRARSGFAWTWSHVELLTPPL